MNKQHIVLVIKSSVIYMLSYLIVGAIAYQLITKQFYIGENPIFTAYLRNELDAAEWAHTNTWIFPAVLLRGLLISLAIVPLFDVLKKMTYWKAVGIVFFSLFILIHLAAAAPSPSNIEGFVYMKSELFSLKAFLLTQPEMIFQTLFYAMGFSWILKGKSGK